MFRSIPIVLASMLFGCSSDGLDFVAWPDAGPDTLSFLVVLDERREIYGPYGPSGPDVTLSIPEAPSIIYTFSRSSLRDIHPFVDSDRLEQTKLVEPRSACFGCGACSVEFGGQIQGAFPDSFGAWTRPAGGQYERQNLEAPSGFALELPSSITCASSVEPDVIVEGLLEEVNRVQTTLPTGEGGVWVAGTDLLWFSPDGRRHALSEKLELSASLDVVRAPDGTYLASLAGPPRVARVATGTSGIEVLHVWTLGEFTPRGIAPTPEGGFVVPTDDLGVLWGSEAGEPARRIDIAVSRPNSQAFASPYDPGEYFMALAFGTALIIDPFNDPDGYRIERIELADKQILRFVQRAGAQGPEVWAVTNGVGLYFRDRAIHEDGGWAPAEPAIPPGTDNCASSPICGFSTPSRDTVEVAAFGSDVAFRAQSCGALIVVRPDDNCATRIEMPDGVPQVMSMSEGRLWGVRGGAVVSVGDPAACGDAMSSLMIIRDFANEEIVVSVERGDELKRLNVMELAGNSSRQLV